MSTAHTPGPWTALIEGESLHGSEIHFVAAGRVGSSPLLGYVVRNDDGTVTANVAVTLTKEQWLEYEHAFRIRGMSCEIGLDSPQVTDRVMFQIFKQITRR